MPYVGTNRIGINAIFNTKSFKIGAKEYMSVLDKVKDQTKYVTNAVSGLSTGGAIGLAGITAGFGLIAIAATAAVGAITVASKAMTELITESTAYAGRIQELAIVVDLLGTRSGYTKTQLGSGRSMSRERRRTICWQIWRVTNLTLRKRLILPGLRRARR